MQLTPLGNGFAKLEVGNTVCYFFRAKGIPADILAVIPDIENPTIADSMTCEIANL